jgi:hypothetical protein
MQLPNIAAELAAFAANLPVWAWVTLLLLAAVGAVWLVVDVVSFLVVAIAVAALTVLGFTYGYPYAVMAWQRVQPYVPQKITEAGAELAQAAEKTNAEAPIVPPAKPHPGTNP